MTEAKKSTSPDALAKAGKGAAVSLTEEELKKVSGGAYDSFHKAGSSVPAVQNSALKLDSVAISPLPTSLHK